MRVRSGQPFYRCRRLLLAASLLWVIHSNPAAAKLAVNVSQAAEIPRYVRFATALQPASDYFNPVSAYYNMWRAPGLNPAAA